MAAKKELTVLETFHLWFVVASAFIYGLISNMLSVNKAEIIKKPKIRLGRHSVLPGKKPMKKKIKKDYEF